MKIESADLENVYDQLLKLVVPKASWVDWLLLKAIMKQESMFNPLAVSPVGARGLMQVMPESDQWANGEVDGFDIYGNIRDGFILLDRFHTFFAQRGIVSPELEMFTVASYNAGPGNIEKARQLAQAAGIKPDTWFAVNSYLYNVTGGRAEETLDYVKKVMAYYQEYKGGTHG